MISEQFSLINAIIAAIYAKLVYLINNLPEKGLILVLKKLPFPLPSFLFSGLLFVYTEGLRHRAPMGVKKRVCT